MCLFENITYAAAYQHRIINIDTHVTALSCAIDIYTDFKVDIISNNSIRLNCLHIFRGVEARAGTFYFD